MAQFLSDEYMTEADRALAEHPGFMNAIDDVELGLQFHVTEAPDGEIDYYLDIKDGEAELSLGTLDDPDATVANTYETAKGISTGELNTQMAFMTGKLKVSGNMAVLMRHQGMINQFSAALSDLDVDY